MDKSRREFLKEISAGAVVLSLPSFFSHHRKPRNNPPNILFIMTDDHAVQAISAYGSRINETPNIDRLAKEGARFDNCLATNAICAPSRATILTGTYSHINGVIDNSAVFDARQITFPKLLQQAGYETALFGKWHLKSQPSGFDYWHILPGQGHYYNPDFISNGERHQEQGYVTDLITDYSLEWLNSRKSSNPFCMMLHHKAPHRNWMPALRHLNLYENSDIPVPETFHDDYVTRSEAAQEQDMSVKDTLMPAYDLKADPANEQDERWWNSVYSRLTPEQKKKWDAAYEPRNKAARQKNLKGDDLKYWKYQRYIKDYLRCIKAVDENIGRVLDFLDTTGLADNTLVIYTSDQGFFLGEHGWFDKRFVYEEALHMPFLVRYPQEISAGQVVRELAANVDFAPTFLDYANVSIPERMQGMSMRPLFQGRIPSDWRDAVYYHYFEYPAVHSVKRHYGIRTERYKLIHFYYDIDAWELYDLKKDPLELHNLANVSAYAGLMKKLKQQLHHLQKQYKDDNVARFLPGKPQKVTHLAAGAEILLNTDYSSRYPGSGPKSLVNGIVAPDNPGSRPDYSVWQGYEGVNLGAVIDLGSVKSVQEVSAGFLENAADWIFLPRKVVVETSVNGEQWSQSGIWHNKKKPQAGPAARRIVRLQGKKENVRYIKVNAISLGVCPSWHPGAGKPCWLFADEIIVK